jgi:phage baseplate assembly protein W
MAFTPQIINQDKTVHFSDFTFDFSPNPHTGDISILTNKASVENSIRNLVKTKFGEVLFDSKVGCGLNFMLFEPMDEITKYGIQQQIQITLSVYEPRVSLQQIDLIEDKINQGYFITIYYSIVNTQGIQSVKVFLERIR